MIKADATQAETLSKEDVKPGMQLRARLGAREMTVTVLDVHDAGFETSFGMIPWSNLPLMRRAS